MDEKNLKFTESLKVLVIEDNQVDRMIIEAMLSEFTKNSSDLQVASTLAAGMKLLAENKFDIIILDLNLPDSSGEETLIHVSSKYPNLPIVVNTGAYEEELGLKTLHCGAQDFLVKGKYTAYILNKVLYYAVERKRLETNLKDAYSKLKLAQDQLIQAEKMKVVGGLASGIAHEVRNPLATILYGVTYLSENVSAEDENYKSVLQNIKDATARADSIIKDLLDFSSLNKLNKQPANINSIIDKGLSLINHEIEKKHIVLIKKYLENIPNINVDINRIQQVIINILLNSIHASQPSGNIIIKTYSQQYTGEILDIKKYNNEDFNQGDNLICVDIEDTGHGIHKEDIDKVFDPFFTTRRAKGGVGLGLSVSQNIIENHKGIISITNREEGGVRATLIFKQEGET